MGGKIKLLAICGSTRQASSNLTLIRVIADLANELFELTLFDDLTALPHFNPDLDAAHTPDTVNQFKHSLSAADAVLICTPEYAAGVPGILKNALDWTVSSMEFSGKPVALITASLSGKKAHESLLGTLLIIEAKMTAATHLLISFIKSKVHEDGTITNEGTLNDLRELMNSLAELVQNKQEVLLSSSLLKYEPVI